MRRTGFLIIVGLAGVAVLVALGIWQVQRLAWKQALLADIEARIAAAPVPLPADVDPGRDAYLPVSAEGIAIPGARVLASVKFRGAGHRMIDVLETADGRRVLLDRGFLPATVAEPAEGPQPVSVMGNLHWPQETDGFTPDPDVAAGLWFAREVAAMAEALDTEPLLIVARDIAPATAFASTPMPVDAASIPNNHLQYAVTWFSLAAVWAGMTVLWLWRITRRED